MWNMMDGQIDWAALPLLVEVYGVDDIEILLAELMAIRKHARMMAENG